MAFLYQTSRDVFRLSDLREVYWEDVRTLQTIRASAFDRHVHGEAYASLVLSGEYEEAGDNGRFRVRAGDVLFHDQYESHLDRFPGNGAVVLNLQMAAGHSCLPGIAKVSDPDAIVRVMETSGRDAAKLLFTVAVRCMQQPIDWPDELAVALIRNPSLKLSSWGEANRLAPWTVSRGFSQVFGISPDAFRARARARNALNSLRRTQQSLATIAADLGFADQSHMTRSIKQLTGVGPQAWRSAANGFKTARQQDV